MEKFKRFVVIPLFTIVTVIVVSVSVIPLIWTLLSSFKTDFEIFSNPLSLPEALTFSSYNYVLETSPVFKFLSNSLIVSFCSTFLQLFTVGMASYVVARKNFGFKNTFIVVVTLTMFIPSMVSTFPTYILYSKIGLIDTKLGLILLFAGGGFAMNFYVLRGAFLSIPKEIEDAAYIDGAGFFRTFIQIMVPMAKGGLFVSGILFFINVWNNFLTPLIFTNSNSQRTLSVMLNYFMSAYATNYSAMFASIVITVIPNIIIFIIFSDKIVGGLTEGSVKG